MKLLVIGLDAVDVGFWRRPDVWGLVDFFDELKTYYWSLPSWMCAITGREFSLSMDDDAFVSHRNYGGKFLWDYLGDVRQVYLNIPTTYPAEDVDGAFVAGDWRCHRMDSNSVRPIELLGDLKGIGYRFNNSLNECASASDWDGFLKELLDIIRFRTDAIKFLAERFDPEFMFSVYRMTDAGLHQRGEKRLGSKRIEEMYSFLGECLKEVLSEVEADTVLFLSDHSINDQGYHGPDWPGTEVGMWGLRTELDVVQPLDMAHILDVVPTIFACMDRECPPMKGHSLVSPEFDRKSFVDKLRRLGYV